MNLSGKAVTAVRTKTRIDDILVIVDDIYLPIGEIRLRGSGGLAGHNGLKSIAEALGTREFKRMRIGVGSPNSKELSDYVLSEFSSNDLRILDQTLSFTSELLEIYISDDFDEMVKYYSKNKKSYSELIMQAQDLSIEN
jgi:PTH1 family peptidyl-tRNA hydrolase